MEGVKKGLSFKPAKLKLNEPETVEHILIHCIAYKNKRHVLEDDLQKMEHNTLPLENLLAKKSGRIPMRYAIFRFLKETGIELRI